MFRTIAVIALLAVIQGCQGGMVQTRPVLENEGAVYVYLQPFTIDADRLSFGLKTIGVVQRDGQPVTLDLRLARISRDTAGRQRLLAAGVVPPGQYTGISLTVVETKPGETSPAGADVAVYVPFSFTVQRKEATVIALEPGMPHPKESMPAFSPFIPERPLSNLTGYVTNREDNTVAVFNKKTRQVSSMLATGSRPSGMAIDSLSGKAFVALSGEDAVDVIDVLAGAVVSRVLLRGGDAPREVALTPDGRTLLAAGTGSNTLSVIDPVSLIETERIVVGDSPNALLIDRAGRRVYVFNNRSNTISVIDLMSKRVIATVATEAGPLRGDFNRGGDRLYVIHERSAYLLVIDTATLAVLRREYIGPGIAAIVVNPATDFIYIGRRYDHFVSVHHPFSFIAMDYLRAGGPVSHLSIDREDQTLYMTVPGKDMAVAVSLFSGKVVAEMDVGDAPAWIGIAGRR